MTLPLIFTGSEFDFILTFNEFQSMSVNLKKFQAI